MSQDYNPYAVLKMIREQGSRDNPTPFLLGKVASEIPFALKVGDLQLDRNDLFVSHRFLNNDNTINNENNINLKIGETVVLLVSADNQTYVLLERVI